MHEDHELVGPETQREQAPLGRLERHDAEVESALQHLDADLA